MQIDVCKNSDVVVFNSEYTRSSYYYYLERFKRTEVIPIGVSEEIFCPRRDDGLVNSSRSFTGIFVGDYNNTKGTSVFQRVCRSLPNITFLYVSKMGHMINLPNVVNCGRQ